MFVISWTRSIHSSLLSWSETEGYGLLLTLICFFKSKTLKNKINNHIITVCNTLRCYANKPTTKLFRLESLL